MSFLRFGVHVCASVLAGIFLGLAFPDFSLWPLALVAMVLMLAVIDSVRVWQAAFLGCVFGLVFWLPHLSWAIISAGGGYLPWLALSFIQAFAWALWAGSASLIARLPWAQRPTGYVFLMALTWVGVEQLRARIPFSGFPWGNVAYPHVDAPIGHLAPIGGETLVSFVLLVVAALLRVALSFGQHFERTMARWWSRPLSVGVALCLYVLPVLLPLPADQQAGAVNIGAVQGGVEVPGRKTYAIEGKVTSNHSAQTLALLEEYPHVDLIVWGEGALDRDPRSSSVVSSHVEESVSTAGVPLMVGFNAYDNQRQVIHNLYAPWYPDSGLSEPFYGKQIPVPFGEYIPFRNFISALATEAAQVRVDMEAVDNSSRLDVHLNDGRIVPLGVGICFEVAYESLWAEGIREGAQILVSPSNNYHFRDSVEPAQQAQMARFRAIEFGRSMVEVSTTGESMLIRPDGGVLAKTPRHASAYIAGMLPLRTSVTPASYIAQPLAYAAMSLWGMAFLAACVHQLRVRSVRVKGKNTRLRQKRSPQSSSPRSK